MEISNVLKLSKKKTKKLCSTLHRNRTFVELSINNKMIEFQETPFYECKTVELFDGDQIVIRDIVYVKNTTEFIRFVNEERGINNLNPNP